MPLGQKGQTFVKLYDIDPEDEQDEDDGIDEVFAIPLPVNAEEDEGWACNIVPPDEGLLVL